MRFQFPTTRRASWGHWGITFYEFESTDLYAKAIKCYGRLNFPCGPQGPIDGLVGSKEREMYKQMCKEWAEHAVLPDNLEQLPI